MQSLHSEALEKVYVSPPSERFAFARISVLDCHVDLKIMLITCLHVTWSSLNQRRLDHQKNLITDESASSRWTTTRWTHLKWAIFHWKTSNFIRRSSSQEHCGFHNIWSYWTLIWALTNFDRVIRLGIGQTEWVIERLVTTRINDSSDVEADRNHFEPSEPSSEPTESIQSKVPLEHSSPQASVDQNWWRMRFRRFPSKLRTMLEAKV